MLVAFLNTSVWWSRSPLLYIPQKNIPDYSASASLLLWEKQNRNQQSSIFFYYYYYFAKFVLLTQKHFVNSLLDPLMEAENKPILYNCCIKHMPQSCFYTSSIKISEFLTLLESQPMYPACPSCICCRKSALDELPVRGAVTTSPTSQQLADVLYSLDNT